ncbi:hypothetical protein ISCGN_004832 [Ixodes scapularis]
MKALITQRDLRSTNCAFFLLIRKNFHVFSKAVVTVYTRFQKPPSANYDEQAENVFSARCRSASATLQMDDFLCRKMAVWWPHSQRGASGECMMHIGTCYDISASKFNLMCHMFPTGPTPGTTDKRRKG